MFKRVAAPLALLLTAGLVLAGCAQQPGSAPSASAGTDEIQRGGVVNVAALGEMVGFDPIKLTNVGSGVERAAQVMDTLLYRDETSDEVHPKLAEAMESADGQTWVMTLREGVTFSDGEPLDAEAVIFNTERHLTEESKSTAKSLLSGIASMSATGEYEVTFELKAPSGSFPLAFTGSSPASLIGSPTALADPEAFNSDPVGAGPFVVESWTRDDTLVLVRNEDYWDEGKPYLDGVTYAVRVDAQTRTDDLIAGGMHLALINGAQWNLVSAADGIELILSPGGGDVLVPNGEQGPGADPRVREAISLAMDPTVTATLFLGGTEYWDGATDCIPFAVGSPACEPGTGSSLDIEKATQLIADFVADGGDPTADLVYFQSNVESATYYQQQLSTIGLDIVMRAVDVAALAESQARGEYDILMTRTASAGYPTQWTRLYSGGTKWGMVAYPELDDALLRARDELELDDRNAAWREVASIVHDEHIVTWTAPYTAAMAFRDELHLSSNGEEYNGSTMVYFDSAWLAQ